MKAINILWVPDDEEVNLPNEIEIPDWVDDDEISAYLSDTTGFCHFGFELVD